MMYGVSRKETNIPLTCAAVRTAVFPSTPRVRSAGFGLGSGAKGWSQILAGTEGRPFTARRHSAPGGPVGDHHAHSLLPTIAYCLRTLIVLPGRVRTRSAR